MRRLLSRLKKLENCRTLQTANRVLTYNPLLRNEKEVLENAGPGKYMLAPNYGSDASWERAAKAQQHELVRVSKTSLHEV